MCNAFVLSLVPTIICDCHSGTGVFSGDHGGFFLLVGYNLVVRALVAFFTYPCDSGLFGVVCVFWWEWFSWSDYFLSCVLVGLRGWGWFWWWGCVPFLMLWLMFLDLILVIWCGVGSFETVCALAGVIFVVFWCLEFVVWGWCRWWWWWLT